MNENAQIPLKWQKHQSTFWVKHMHGEEKKTEFGDVEGPIPVTTFLFLNYFLFKRHYGV